MTDATQRVEEKLVFVERHVEQLDEVVRQLAERVDALHAELVRLREDLKKDDREGDHAPSDDVPPHWGGRVEP